MIKKALLILILLSTYLFGKSQKVGLVMSGGGASGMAHIGVLMALEENGIPIDYITGTSAGALVGGLYAIGYTPSQIMAMASSEEYFAIANGEIDKKYTFFFKQRPENAGIVNFTFDKKFKLNSSIPLNFTDPALIDFFMLEQFSQASKVTNYNFDSLIVPFRCVASDIDANEEVVFKEGNLSQAVRASMTFPFYIPPLKIDDKILVDGGLYNNFPADVMYNDFMPDVIIGSSVTAPRRKPNEYDLLSQVRGMIQTKSDFEINCDNSIIIQPDVNEIGTFDFDKTRVAILKGYEETLKNMDSIKRMVSQRLDTNALKEKRKNLLEKIQAKIVIANIEIDGLNKREEQYIISTIKDKNREITLSELKPRFFRLVTDDKIEFMFPSLVMKPGDSSYTLKIRVKKTPDFDFRVGGSFTSKSNNTGYLGLDYKYINRYLSLTASGNFYFGRFYNSLDIAPRIDFPLDLPFYIEPHLTYNRWDYYRSFSTFFEDTKPSFLIKNETFAGLSIGLPVANKGKIVASFKNGLFENEYYQTDQFLSIDTADITEFFVNKLDLEYEFNSLDNFYYSTQGSKLKLKAGFVDGIEINRAGSTSLLTNDTVNRIGHDWFQFSVNFEQYFTLGKTYSLGIELEGVHSFQDFFNNYTASVLFAPQFSPIPETQTQFIPQFAAHTYAAVGIKNVFNIYKLLDLRVEGYAFLPYANIVDNNKMAEFSPNIKATQRNYIVSSILVFNSPLGPVSLTANYMDHRKEKWSFLFNFNFLVFNRKGLDPL